MIKGTPTSRDTGPQRRRRQAIGLMALLLAGLLAVPSGASHTGHAVAAEFDLDEGNSGIELVIPVVIQRTLQSVSPTGGDASLVVRITTEVTNGWFDAIAPYHPSAVGVFSDLGRRPEGERTDRNRNIAMLYASRRVMTSLLPQHENDWRRMLEAAGLDPDDDSTDPSTAVGIGNAAGAAVVQVREADGMNQLGDEPDSMLPGQPYSDTTGYEPVNTPTKVVDPSRWQPLVVGNDSGIYRAQTFITPQWSQVQAYSYDDVDAFSVPSPTASTPRGKQGWHAYAEQAREVLTVSQSLSDEQKLTAELFDNKFLSLGFSALFASQSRGMSLEQFVHYDFLLNVAAFDVGIAVWKEKMRYDAVRPVTAMRVLSSEQQYPGWGGSGEQFDAADWTSYLPTADHPEYPSGSAAFCAAHAEASRLYLGDDTLGWTVPSSAGSSRLQPGVVPAQDTTLTFETWTDFEQQCGQSRLWGGVHFQAAITESQNLGRPIGVLAHDFVQRHIAGDV